MPVQKSEEERRRDEAEAAYRSVESTCRTFGILKERYIADWLEGVYGRDQRALGEEK